MYDETQIEVEDLKQIRFVDGSEVLCEIMDQTEDELVIRLALKIERVDMKVEETLSTVSYHVFRPFMSHQTGTHDLITIYKYQILALCNPVEEVINQYYKYLSADDEPRDDLDDFINGMESMSAMSMSSDSDDSNIISLADRNKLH